MESNMFNDKAGTMFEHYPVDPGDFNPDFLTCTLRNFNEPETRYWQLMDYYNYINRTVFEYLVPPHTEEAEEIMHFLYDNTTNLNRRFVIRNITRVQNPYLMISYLTNKDLARKTYGNEQVNYKYYLHGTPRQNINDICTFNFDLSTVKRHRDGWGIYFTPDIAKAQKFCDKNVYTKEVVLAYVIESKLCVGNENMTYPDSGTDTSRSPTDDKVIVKYDDDTYYPAYRIVFDQLF